MDLSELAQKNGETEDALRAWDWRASLKAEERSIPWLARHTNKSQRTVYDYAYGILTPPIAWLREAARLLGKGS